MAGPKDNFLPCAFRGLVLLEAGLQQRPFMDATVFSWMFRC